MLPLYAMYLLAEFRETRAYRPMVRVARTPGVDEFLADIVTKDLDRIMGAVWDGDSEPLLELLGDSMGDEFARSAGLSAIGVLYRAGRMDRPELLALLDEAYDFRLERTPMLAWDTWVALVAVFGIHERLERVRELYREGLANPGFEPLDSVEKRIPKGGEEWEIKHYSAFTTTVDEMSWWHSFTDAAAREEIKEDLTSREKAAAQNVESGYDGDDLVSGMPMPQPPKPHVRTSQKVGRNDPCPCGSGKKYKKCCLDG